MHTIPMKDERVTRSPEETLALAEDLGRHAAPGDLFALTGDLGTGKTVIAKGIARGLGVAEEVTSPTFTLLEIYPGRLPFYHFDLYRIENDGEFDNLFFEEYWEGDGVSVIEWAERAGNRLPAGHTRITLSYIDDHTRRITVERIGD